MAPNPMLQQVGSCYWDHHKLWPQGLDEFACELTMLHRLLPTLQCKWGRPPHPSGQVAEVKLCSRYHLSWRAWGYSSNSWTAPLERPRRERSRGAGSAKPSVSAVSVNKPQKWERSSLHPPDQSAVQRWPLSEAQPTAKGTEHHTQWKMPGWATEFWVVCQTATDKRNRGESTF